jgi:DNA repair exonuclease SbcCD ATPase subunit
MTKPTREEVEQWLEAMQSRGTLFAPRAGWWDDLGNTCLALLDENEQLRKELEDQQIKDSWRATEEKESNPAHDLAEELIEAKEEIERLKAAFKAAWGMVKLNEDGYQTAEEWQAAIDNLREALAKLAEKRPELHEHEQYTTKGRYDQELFARGQELQEENERLNSALRRDALEFARSHDKQAAVVEAARKYMQAKGEKTQRLKRRELFKAIIDGDKE